MSATTIRTDIDATRAGVPPAPPEAHQQAGVVSGHGYSFTVPSTSSPELLVQDGLHFRAATPDEIVAAGRAILLAGLNRGPIFDTPMAVKDYVRLQYGALEHEVFAVMFLDSQHRLIAVEEMFRGSLSQTSVYPREVLKSALKHNAGATLLVHCHPSGQATPSRADEHLTQQLKAALQMIDVRVLDHLIATRDVVASMAELGLI